MSWSAYSQVLPKQHVVVYCSVLRDRKRSKSMVFDLIGMVGYRVRTDSRTNWLGLGLAQGLNTDRQAGSCEWSKTVFLRSVHEARQKTDGANGSASAEVSFRLRVENGRRVTNRRAYSSAGKSARLISVRSVVQIYLGPHLTGGKG